jgi:hypothetical protein
MPEQQLHFGGKSNSREFGSRLTFLGSDNGSMHT